jgi:putative phosphoribosyl transferase
LNDLLTPDAETLDAASGECRFDIPRLARRLVGIDWLRRDMRIACLRPGLFGASTGAAAALMAAAERPCDVDAVVRAAGGRTSRARRSRASPAPTLLIVGSVEVDVIP